jgi:hypothetical protein
MSQPSDGMTTGEEQGRSEMPATSPPTPTPPKPSGIVHWLGWLVGIVGIVFAIGIFFWAQQQRRSWQDERSVLQQAIASARQVFLKRASDELGYASVDLEGNLPNRYQASFRIGEALRWLQDAEPLLSPEGQRQAATLRQTLSQLTVTAGQDPAKAREELSKVRDALERLIRTETRRR